VALHSKGVERRIWDSKIIVFCRDLLKDRNSFMLVPLIDNARATSVDNVSGCDTTRCVFWCSSQSPCTLRAAYCATQEQSYARLVHLERPHQSLVSHTVHRYLVHVCGICSRTDHLGRCRFLVVVPRCCPNIPCHRESRVRISVFMTPSILARWCNLSPVTFDHFFHPNFSLAAFKSHIVCISSALTRSSFNILASFLTSSLSICNLASGVFASSTK